MTARRGLEHAANDAGGTLCGAPGDGLEWHPRETGVIDCQGCLAIITGRSLIAAMDAMHAKGETFTGRVSIACAALRRIVWR